MIFPVFLAGFACSPEANSLEWAIAFSDPAMTGRAEVVEARILESGCSSSRAVYTARFRMDEEPALPPELGKGTYGFSVRARDAECRWYAAGCTEKRLPITGERRIRVELEAGTEPSPDCTDCRAASCATPDAGDDAASDTGTPDVGPAPPPITILLEAESADTLAAPLTRVDDATASGGAFITNPYDDTLGPPITDFKRNDPPAPDADGLATYVLDLPGGRYRIWARVIMPTLDEDSFWLRMDEGSWFLWNDVAHGMEWHWVDVRDFATRTRELVFDLGEGSHTLAVSYRELNAKLDQLLITNDLTHVPADP